MDLVTDSVKKNCVSIIVTMYNVAPYLRRCLKSIIHQSYQNLDIILIDDGSTDGSGDVASIFMKKDRRIRLFSQLNCGVAVARNTGIQQAKGEWIMFVDGDDMLECNAVDVLLSAALKHRTKLCMGSYRVFAPNSARHNKFIKVRETDCRDTLSAQKYFLTDGQNHSFPWAKLYHQSVFANVRFPDGKFYEDIWILPYILDAAGGCCVVNHAVYRYYLREGSITFTRDIRKHMDGLNARLSSEAYIQANYPMLSRYAADCVIDFCFFLMGRICRAGRRYNQKYWKFVIETLRKHDAAGSPQNKVKKVAVMLSRANPILTGYLCNAYSYVRNRI